MKNLGNISNNADVVTKKYVDDRDVSSVDFTASTLTLNLGSGSKTASVPTFNQNTTGSAGSAAKWTNERIFKISDGTNNGGEVRVDGSNTSGYTLPLPTSLSLSGTLGVSGATTLAALTVSGLVNLTNTGDYSATDNEAALKVAGGVYIAKKLRVNDNIYLSNSKHIYGYDTLGNAFSLLSLSSSNNVLVGYGGSTRANYNTYIDGNTIYIRNRFTADGSTSTTTTQAIVIKRDTINSNTAVRVGIFTNSPQYPFHVVGESYLGGKVNLGGTIYYLGNGAAASNLYSLTVGSSSALEISSVGVVSIANTTDYTSASSAALKVSGGAYIAKKLMVGTNLDVTSNATIGGTLGVTGIATFNTTTKFLGALWFGGSAAKRIDTIGNAWLGSINSGGITATGAIVTTDDTDYSVTEGIVSSSLKTSGGAYIGKKLYVNDSTEIHGVLNITGVTGYAQGIRIHPSGGTSSIWFGAVNNTGFDAGMWGITVDTAAGDNPSTKIRIRGTETADSTNPVDYLTINNGGKVTIVKDVDYSYTNSTHSASLLVNGGAYITKKLRVGTYVGINVEPSTSYRLYVSGAARITGATTLGSTLSVGSTVTLAGTRGSTQRIYFGDTSHYIECDASGYLHTNVPFYSDSWVASGGIGNAGGSGGGGVNVNTYSQIQTGIATGVASENNTYVPTSYALRQVYNTTSGLSTTVANLRAGSSDFSSIVIQKTNNSPTVTFRGEYDGTAGANITLGTISGYKQTISSVAYSGLSVNSDLFIPNGKRIYTYTYGGAVRSVVYYPTDNYNELRFGDSAGTTRIYGSSIYLGESSLHSVNITGVTSVTNDTDATGSSTAALKVSGGAYIGKTLIVNGNIVPNTTGANTIGSSSKRFERAYIRYIDTPSGYNLRFCSAGSEAMNINTSGNVYIGGSTSASCKLEVNGDIKAANIIGTGALKYSYNGQEYSVLYLTGTGSVSLGVAGSAMSIQGSSVSISGATTFSNAVTIDSASIGSTTTHLIFNRAGYNYLYASNSSGTFSFITNGQLEGISVASSYTSLLINKYGISVKTNTAPTSSVAFRVNGNSVISGTLSVANYSVKGRKEYNLTSIFSLSANTAIPDATIDGSSIESFLSDISNGRAVLYYEETVTINGSSYSMRYDVQVADTSGSQSIGLYYLMVGTSPQLQFEFLTIGYVSSTWKVTMRTSKAIN